MNCYSAIDSSGPAQRLWQMLAIITALGLIMACSSKKEEKPGSQVLQTRSGETSIQVTESEQDGSQVVRITTTFRGKESNIVMAVDHPVYEVDIPLSISQQQPALTDGGTAGAARGRGGGGGGGAGGFQDLLIAQYLEKSQVAMLDGIYNEALRQVNLVLMVQPDHVPARQMKGSIYYAMGNFELANQEWEQVLALDPSNQEVRDFQDFLKNRQGAPQPPLPGGQPSTGAAQ